jgi:hypothetical protein
MTLPASPTTTADQHLISWADRLGIPIVLGRPTGPVWDGHQIYAGVIEKPSDLAHEIAHWVLATPEQRVLENFGLGRDWQDGQAATVVTAEEHADIEQRASALGIEMLKVVDPDGWKTEISSYGQTMFAATDWAGRWAEHVAAVTDHVEPFRTHVGLAGWPGDPASTVTTAQVTDLHDYVKALRGSPLAA